MTKICVVETKCVFLCFIWLVTFDMIWFRIREMRSGIVRIGTKHSLDYFLTMCIPYNGC